MKIQSILNIDGYNLLIQNYANNFYRLNIVDANNRVYHFEGIYSSPQVAIDKGKSVIKNFQYLTRENFKPV